MFWLPPGRFSTTTGWDQTFCRPCATARAMVSGEPPGVRGTMMRIGRSGKVCAPANEEIRARQPAHSNFFMRTLLGPHPEFTDPCIISPWGEEMTRDYCLCP